MSVGRFDLSVQQRAEFVSLNRPFGDRHHSSTSQAAIARKANLCPRTVSDALKRLHGLGILTWVRRCWEGWTDGRYVRRQQTNAYAILPSTGWHGFRRPRDEPPAPHPDTWGKPPAMPSILAAAAMERCAGGTLKEAIRVLELGPVNGLEAALARLGRAVLTREK